MVAFIFKTKEVKWKQLTHHTMQMADRRGHPSSYPSLDNITTLYFQFIDKKFFRWNGTKSELIKFMTNLNKNFLTIQYEFKSSRKGIIFSDIKISYVRHIRNKVTDETFYIIN